MSRQSAKPPQGGLVQLTRKQIVKHPIDNQKHSEWIACATRRNVDGKADYLWILSYSNGVPVRYPSEATALEAATRVCADPAHALYGPRAVEQHN